MGCNDGKGGAAIAVSDATAAMSDDTRAAPVNLLRPRHQLRYALQLPSRGSM